jgi:hypothetical protein
MKKLVMGWRTEVPFPGRIFSLYQQCPYWLWGPLSLVSLAKHFLGKVMATFQRLV